ncbi:hypothetical protein NQ318_014308 [Aromia moschata]|uniref:guanylate cyclase n=1 Tax=Aromia moschata TaxID=1265417 RepID=A0AAV8Z1J4_9CUCU|nr:hypothetical protein NQ318_014308 [Aromia moschata]
MYVMRKNFLHLSQSIIAKFVKDARYARQVFSATWARTIDWTSACKVGNPDMLSFAKFERKQELLEWPTLQALAQSSKLAPHINLVGSISTNEVAQKRSNHVKSSAILEGRLTGSDKGLERSDSGQTFRTCWGCLSGMKYLHSTPIRVHGYLTSRNCVIDARWVLKVTDYGLPAFFEAQGIQPPAKTARGSLREFHRYRRKTVGYIVFLSDRYLIYMWRFPSTKSSPAQKGHSPLNSYRVFEQIAISRHLELLWTAPELLRHSSLRKKGTQSGDVYSFGIILQEVVVRGEPFCMLALTPEEIIEKVKRPPPLIRPSVSKGAAPPEGINIMRQCWAEQPEMRPDFNTVHEHFKKLNHGRKVNIVDTMFQMLEKYSNNLEELIRERTEQLDIEKKKTEQLLNRMLPSYVAEKLKLGMPVDPEEFEEVTIYFSDIVGFTTISAHSTPFQVVDLLNDLYTCFDATINAYNVYKVETIGDAYMVVGGLPVRVPDHAEQVATMALDLLHQSGTFCIRHLPGTPLRLRIGLHSGPCCAGVVGLTMPRYCLFGDTFCYLFRSLGSAWRIHLSEATKKRLERAGGYQIEYRGPTEIKGKGTMDTYWLLGKAGFVKPLPDPPSIEYAIPEKSAIAEHVHTNEDHKIDYGNIRVLDKTTRYYPRIIRESLETMTSNNNFNWEDGYRLSNIWRLAICTKNQ